MISKEILIKYAVHPFNLYEKNLELWNNIKIIFNISYIISSFIISRFISNFFNFSLKNNLPQKKKKKENIEKNLKIFIGKNLNNSENIYISEYGLYQNILITGTIGSGKTSSAMYPITEQLIKYKCDDFTQKIGMLLLDVKGNYYNQVKKFAYENNRMKDIVVIEVGGENYYNPLDKPDFVGYIIKDT